MIRNMDIKDYTIQERYGKYGCIDNKGNIIIPFIYDYIDYFFDGVAAVEKDGKVGYINRQGEIISPCIFRRCDHCCCEYRFKRGRAIVYLNNQQGYLNTKGELTIARNGKWGCVDKDGNTIISFQYDGVGEWSNGLLPVKLNGKWGCINKSEEIIIPYQYDEMGYYSEGYIPVMLKSENLITNGKNKWGFIDLNNKVVVPFIYTEVEEFSDGVARVKRDDQWGCLDKKFNIITPFKYDHIRNFSEGLACVIKDNKLGYINTSGKLVIPCIYDEIDTINMHFETMLGYLTYAHECDGGHVLVALNGKAVLLDKSGKVLSYNYDYENHNFTKPLECTCQ